MHRDLAYRITAVHNDLHRLIGVLIPDLDQALDQQAQSLVRLLNIPVDIAERLRYAALAERPECGNDECFELQDLSDAFILNYDKSIVNFTAGLLVTERIPPVDQYLNLLKCVWIFKRIAASPVLSNAEEDSHWPSYTRQLENVSPGFVPPHHCHAVANLHLGSVVAVWSLRPRSRATRVFYSGPNTRYVFHLARDSAAAACRRCDA